MTDQRARAELRCPSCGTATAASEPEGRDEMVCDRCGRHHGVVWFAPSDVWNQVMRGGDRGNPDEFGFCCPICFMALAEERGIVTTGWCVSPEPPAVSVDEGAAEDAQPRHPFIDYRRPSNALFAYAKKLAAERNWKDIKP